MAEHSSIHLRSPRGDHTLSLTKRGVGHHARWLVRLSTDDPLTYGYDEVGTALDEQQIKRLLCWLTTGRAPFADEELPDLPNHPTEPTEANPHG